MANDDNVDLFAVFDDGNPDDNILLSDLDALLNLEAKSEVWNGGTAEQSVVVPPVPLCSHGTDAALWQVMQATEPPNPPIEPPQNSFHHLDFRRPSTATNVHHPDPRSGTASVRKIGPLAPPLPLPTSLVGSGSRKPTPFISPLLMESKDDASSKPHEPINFSCHMSTPHLTNPSWEMPGRARSTSATNQNESQMISIVHMSAPAPLIHAPNFPTAFSYPSQPPTGLPTFTHNSPVNVMTDWSEVEQTTKQAVLSRYGVNPPTSIPRSQCDH